MKESSVFYAFSITLHCSRLWLGNGLGFWINLLVDLGRTGNSDAMVSMAITASPRTHFMLSPSRCQTTRPQYAARADGVELPCGARGRARREVQESRADWKPDPLPLARPRLRVVGIAT